MRFYRVEMIDEVEGSQGYQYFTNHEEARTFAKQNQPADQRRPILAIDVTPTRAGILRALNNYGGHPDNG